MGCLKGANEDVASTCASTEDHSLRSLLSFRQPALPDSLCKTLQWRLGLGCVTYKTLQARSRLLDTASHGLAKAKEFQKTLKNGGMVTLTERNPTPETLFPLPLPPGYQPLNSKLENPNPGSNRSTNSTSEAFTPSSTASSNSIFGASLSSSSLSSASSSSSSSNDHGHTLQAVTSSLTPNNQLHSSSPSSLLQLLPLPSLENEQWPQRNVAAPKSEMAPPIEFSPHQVAQACGNFKDTHRLRNGTMGPLYRATLQNTMSTAREKIVVIERAEINMSYKRWKAQIHSLASMTHPNLCKIIGFSYERIIKEHDGHVQQWRSIGYIIWDNFPTGSLYELLHNGLSPYVEWHARLKIAIGVAKGISFLLGKLPSQNLARLKTKNIKLDTSFNPTIFDYALVGTNHTKKGGDIVRDFGIMLLELFNFTSYPQVLGEGMTECDEMPLIEKDTKVKDAKVVIDLAASCLLPHPSLRPSMQYAIQTLQRLHQSSRLIQGFPMSSKASTFHKRRNSSFA